MNPNYRILSIGLWAILQTACEGASEPTTQRTRLTEIAPATALPGDTITLTGKRLGKKGGELYFGDLTGEVTAWSPTEIKAIVPYVEAGSYPVFIRIGKFMSNELTLVVGEKPNIDRTLPETTFTLIPGALTNQTSVLFAFQGTDDVGLGYFECQFDGGAWDPCTSPLTLTIVDEGSHHFDVRSVDTSKNKDSTPATVTWQIDLTLPQTFAISGPASVTSSTTAIFGFNGFDLSAMEFICRLDAGTPHSCTSPEVYPSLATGAHTFTVQGIDAAGNADLSPAEWSWVIDQTPPDTTISSNHSSITNATVASFAFAGSDNIAISGFECRLNTGAWTACNSPKFETDLTEGTHTFSVRAIDAATNTDLTPATVTWTVDLTRPGTTITAGPGTVTSATNATFVFSGSDNVAIDHFECKLDVGSWETCSSPKNFISLSTGAHTFYVRAVDTLEQTEDPPASWSWAIAGMPWIDQRYPHIATTGTVISLIGQYFGAVSGIATIGGVPANIQGWSDTNIQFSVTAGTAKGAQQILVTTSAGQTSNAFPISIRGNDVWLVGDIPEGRAFPTAVWTGKEMIIWGGYRYAGAYYQTGGRYNPNTDSWVSTSLVGAPAGRQHHSSVWTGTEVIVWGGNNSSYLNSGGRYNPSSDSWSNTATAGAPSARRRHTAVWTGTTMVVWGGIIGTTYYNDGARYDPNTNTWLSISTTGAPTIRESHSAVWTGEKVLVWGGANGSTYLNTGGSYDPINNTWSGITTTGAPSIRQNPTAVWTGTKMIIWGGGFDGGNYVKTGGLYEPATDSWMSTATLNAPDARSFHSALWTGTHMLIWGGGGAALYNTGGRYDPIADTWLSTSTTGAPETRYNHAAVWTGTNMLIWGGEGSAYWDNGGRYDPASNSWTGFDGAGEPPVRRHHTAVWTGSQMIVWGGFDNPTYRNTGGRYTPSTDTWLDTNTAGAPFMREHHTAVWTGSRMIIWGGYYNSGFGGYIATGANYDPTTNSWSSQASAGEPTAREYHKAVWTGSSMVVWGGYSGVFPLTGGRYDPVGNLWSTTSTANVPSGRYGFAAVWTGTEMIVWGGTDDQTGGRYNPNTDIWMSTAVTGAPTRRSWHTAAWTGTQMVVWGGIYNSILLNTGGRYDPNSDTWASTSLTNAPTARRDHTAIWTGTEMIVWGGDGSLPTGGRYDPIANSWLSTTQTSAPSRRETHTAIWTGAEMLIWAGYNGGAHLSSLGRYLP